MVGKRCLAVSVLALVCACRGSGGPEPTTKGGYALVRLDPKMGPKAGNLPAQLETQAGKARARGLRPYVELRAEWCEPCKKLEAGGPELDAAFQGTYLVQLDVDAWSGKLGGFASAVIPVFIEIDDRGRPTGRRLDGSALRGDDVKELAAFFAKK